MAFRAPEPDAQPEAVAEPGGPRAAGVVAEPDAQREAAAPDAAMAAEPDAQQAVAAASGVQPAVALASDAQQQAAEAVVSDVQPGAVLAPMVEAVKLRARPLVASVEPAETAAVRLWFRAMMVSAAALEPALVSAVKVQAAADRWPVACRLLRAAAVRQPPATLARLSFRALLASALGQEPSAKVPAPADR